MEAATSQERDWSSLPVDMLAQILSRIKWSSHPSFGLVCRQWQSARARSPFYPAWITPLLLNAANVGSTTSFRYYSPYYNKSFEIDTKVDAPPGAKIFCAAGGLHLALGMPYKVLSAELGTGDMNVLPPVPKPSFDFAVYDDGAAGRMYGVDTSAGLSVSLGIRHSNGEWGPWADCDMMDFDPPFRVSPGCNPVLHDGSLYILGEDGRLVVYNGSSHDQWFEILEKPYGFGFKCQDSYLFESDRRELMAISAGLHGTPFIVKLNKHTMEWDRMESLQGRTLFTGTLTTMMKRTNIKWMEDKVLLPTFFNCPDTIQVHLVQLHNELAFVPKPGFSHAAMQDDNYDTNMWTYELGQGEEARAFWGIQRVDHGIWVDFTST